VKRFIFVVITILIAGTVFAQGIVDDRAGNNNRQDKTERADRNNRQREVKSVTIEGTLQLEKGLVAVKSGDTVYSVPMLTRYIGFIEGLKEGAKVSVEGIEARNFIWPKKATIAGKDYNFLADGRGPGFKNDRMGPGQQRRGDFGPGREQGPSRKNSPRRGGSCCNWT